MVWLWSLEGHDSQQTQAVEGVCLHIYAPAELRTHTHMLMSSPSDARLDIVDSFSSIWHEALGPDCHGKTMKGLH